MTDPSMPTPEKGPRSDKAGEVPLEGAAFGAPDGARLLAISSLQCPGMGKDDLRFLVETCGGREISDEPFEELWSWVTTAPHDTLFARAPTDETIVALSSEISSWDIGRRTVQGLVEYYAALRFEKGDWRGVTLTVSHFEGANGGERVLFSASVGATVKPEPGGAARQALVERLIRLCGLSDFKFGKDGADMLARSATLADSAEFSIFCG